MIDRNVDAEKKEMAGISLFARMMMVGKGELMEERDEEYERKRV